MTYERGTNLHIGRSNSHPDWSGNPLQSGCDVEAIVVDVASVGGVVGRTVGAPVGEHAPHVVAQFAATIGFVRH